MIAILDCEMGNLQSVFHGIDIMGYDCEILKSNELNDDNTHLVLPGVGNYHQVMSSQDIANVKKTTTYSLVFCSNCLFLINIC